MGFNSGFKGLIYSKYTGIIPDTTSEILSAIVFKYWTMLKNIIPTKVVLPWLKRSVITDKRIGFS
jgi:hypothetical protein